MAANDICKHPIPVYVRETWLTLCQVLACAIALTFLAGLIKLWWINRSVRKHEILDEEKKERLSEMRKSGLPVGKKADIPFGVRAIQSGIEVDGIWISRPGTPASGSPIGAYSATLRGSECELKGKESAGPTQQPSPTVSTVEQPMDVRTSSQPRSPALGPQVTYKPRHPAAAAAAQPSYCPSEPASRESPQRPRRTSSERPHLQTYSPTTSSSPPRAAWLEQRYGQPERTSSDSDEGLTMANPKRNHGRGSYYPPNSRSASYDRGAERPGPAGGDQPAAEGLEQEQLGRRPERSYSGETHANRATRRVNAGFEVLPAGTFGSSAATNDDSVDLESGEAYLDSSRSPQPAANKLHKKTRSRSSSQVR